MKRIILIFVSLIIFIAIIFGWRFLFGGSEDNWLCQDGEWIKHGSPSAPRPTSGCEKKSEAFIRVNKPAANERVSSPIIIQGEARGGWYFEGEFSLRLESLSGKEIASSFALAQADWMTDDYVEFKSELEYFIDSGSLANLVFKKNNPSGLSENDDQLIVPLVLSANSAPDKQRNIKAYFLNKELDPEMTCTKVFGVERGGTSTPAAGRTALTELLAGPTEEEKQTGYSTAINEGVSLNDLIIKDGIARADFSSELNNNVAGACRVSAIRAQIDETLKQFLSIDKVLISINGKSEGILEP
ncbi:MAG: GerMN domain-containing protein [Patescibacteria group bacterium]|nr:GerMN domain-containing protein [Patescibacteria group bacterium]